MDTDNRVVNPEAEGKGELEGVNGEEKGDIFQQSKDKLFKY